MASRGYITYATQGSNTGLADRVPGRSATHVRQPCIGQASSSTVSAPVKAGAADADADATAPDLDATTLGLGLGSAELDATTSALDAATAELGAAAAAA